ncbi:MAG: anti-virulence regulator CigR family protein, partial [Candidatus Eiseniibacteriota bacterium]
AFAQGKSGSHGHKGGDAGGVPSAGQVVADAITAAERSIILSYIGAHRSEPGLQAKPLPPGIQKNLARGKPLPPGIAKRYLPGNLLAQLPPRPGYEWRIVGTDVLLVVAATQLIVGILNGAL